MVRPDQLDRYLSEEGKDFIFELFCYLIIKLFPQYVVIAIKFKVLGVNRKKLANKSLLLRNRTRF